jgi:hypothetical protein
MPLFFVVLLWKYSLRNDLLYTQCGGGGASEYDCYFILIKTTRCFLKFEDPALHCTLDAFE